MTTKNLSNALLIALLSISSICFSQTIINNGNFTFTGLFTPAAPIIDGNITDACWVNSLLGGDLNLNRLNGGVFPNSLTKVINLNDGGTASGAIPTPVGPQPSGTSASFSLVWDEDFLYFCVKVVDPRLLTQTVIGSLNANASIDLFFNNGNGVSALDPGEVTFPRRYNYSKDINATFQFNQYSDLSQQILPPNFHNYGISVGISGYEAVSKGTADGYVMEGKINWKVINSEFIDQITELYTDVSKIPSASRMPFRFDIANSIPKDDFSSRVSQLMWNQCCWNTNWTQSQHFGTLKLIGAVKIFTATGITIGNSVAITTSSSTAELTAIVSPVEAPQGVNWSVSGLNGSGFPVAKINKFGILYPLNNGTVTIIASTIPYTVAGFGTVPSITTTTTLIISNQVSPTSVNISASTITSNWGTSGIPSFSVLPAGAPSIISWSLLNPSSGPILAKMNTVTGEVTSTALANGTVTIVGTSLANGVVGTYRLPIVNQDPISCFALAAYTNVAPIELKTH